MATQINNANILITSPKWDVSVIPQELKGTYRMLLKYFETRYESDLDLNVTLFFKLLNNDIPRQIILTLPASQVYAKIKLPRFLVVREFYFTIAANNLTNCTIYSVEVLWLPYPVGVR